MESVAYMRVTTENQAEEGNGLESQKRDIENYTRKNELIITDWYIDDGYTGANMDRPQLQRLISDCCKKRVKCVVAFKLDRLSRSMVDGLYIIERVFLPNKVDFKCVHDSVSYDSPMEQAYTQMMAVFAQLDKNTMMLRMRGGMLERVKKGYWMGGGNEPYCYSYDRSQGILVPIPERAQQARDAMDLFISGYSDVKIYKMLGYTSENVVRSILTSPVNIGLIPYKGNIYKGLHEPIFEVETYNIAKELRKTRRKNKFVNSPNLLTGLCYCGVCGCAMRYQKWTKAGRHKIYCCSRSEALDYLPNHNPQCNNTAEWEEEIEEKVETEIKKISLNLRDGCKTYSESALEIAEKQLSKEQAKLKRLYELYSDGNDTVIDMIKEKEATIKNIKDRIKEEQDNAPSERGQKIVYENIKKIADVWDGLDIQSKNKILKSVIKKILITKNNIEIILNDF